MSDEGFQQTDVYIHNNQRIRISRYFDTIHIDEEVFDGEFYKRINRMEINVKDITHGHDLKNKENKK